MIKQKQIDVISILQTGRYIIKDDKVFNRKGRELFTNPLPTGYIQCIMYNGKRYGKGIRVIVYKHILIYLHNFGEYPEGYVIDHQDRINTNNMPNNLIAKTPQGNRENSEHPKEHKPSRNIRAKEIEQIKELLKTTANQSQIARELKLNRLAVRYVIKKIEQGNKLKYE
jgi:hypothetical protein